MLGTILHYSRETGEGIISGDDGERYAFVTAEWKESGSPHRGARVDFVGESGIATAVYRAASAGLITGGADWSESLRRLTEPGSGMAGDLVEPSRRVLAFLVEIGIGFLVNIVVSVIVLIPAGASAFALGLGAVLLWQFIGWIITTAVMFGYYWFMYTKQGAGAGAGHLIIGARPVDNATGEAMSPQQATTRAAVAAAPWFFVGTGWMIGIWALFQLANGLLVVINDDRRNLYDHIAKTRVVNARDRTNPAGEG